jgi:hypothetical protein
MLFLGTRKEYYGDITALPFAEALKKLRITSQIKYMQNEIKQ